MSGRVTDTGAACAIPAPSSSNWMESFTSVMVCIPTATSRATMRPTMILFVFSMINRGYQLLATAGHIRQIFYGLIDGGLFNFCSLFHFDSVQKCGYIGRKLAGLSL